MTTERITILVVGGLNVAAGALLVATDSLPADLKMAALVVQAVAIFVLAQVRSWDDAAPAEPPHG